MALTVVTPAEETDLTTLLAVKAMLGLTDADDDALLIGMIARASSAISGECRRVFGRETVTETLDGSGTRLLGLSRYPVVSVSAVTEDDVAITDYSIEDADAGALYRAVGWGRTGGLRMWGTEAFASGYILPGIGASLRYGVTYVAGYKLPGEVGANLPGLVEQACLETVKAWYLGRDADPSIASVAVGQLKVSYRNESSAPLGSLPSSALGMLRDYYAGGLR